MRGASENSSKSRPKQAGSTPWSEREVEILVSMWGGGNTNAQISAKIGRPENAVAIKASRLRLPPKHIAVAKMSSKPGVQSDARVRPCLTCRQPFFSEGKFNRICEPCKSSGDGGSDYVVSLGGGY